MKKPPEPVTKFATEQGIRSENLGFVDIFGAWEHIGIPAGELIESVVADEFAFDGSSIRRGISTEASDTPAIPGHEPESFIFENVQRDQKANGTFWSGDREEATRNTSPGNLRFTITPDSTSTHRFGFLPAQFLFLS